MDEARGQAGRQAGRLVKDGAGKRVPPLLLLCQAAGTGMLADDLLLSSVVCAACLQAMEGQVNLEKLQAEAHSHNMLRTEVKELYTQVGGTNTTVGIV